MKPKSKPKVTFIPTPSISPEAARRLRVAAWSYVFSCYEKHKAAECSQLGGRDDTEERSSDDFHADNAILRHQ